MNIICIHTHDSGRYFQPYGYPIISPNILAFAKSGILFRNAYAACPTCSPSRAAMMTGQYPHSCGMLGLAHRGFQMDDYSHHLATYLKEQGIETVLCGIQHEAPNAEMLGYSRILDNQNYNMGKVDFDSERFDRDNCSKVCDFLSENHEKPFFLSFGCFNTHRVYPKHSDAFDPRYVMPPVGIYDNPKNREDMADYMYSASICDDIVGQVMEAICQNGLRENTVIIFTTDHGLALPNMKCTLYDGGTGITLIMDYPENNRRGEVIDTLVSNIDIFPTLCDILGIEKPDWLQGRSLIPVLNGNVPARDSVFTEINFHTAYEPVRAVRTERYKYIKEFDSDLTVIKSNIDASSAKSFLLENQCLQYEKAREGLYDLYKDPLERVNLAKDKSYEGIKAELSEKLDAWMAETNDILRVRQIDAPIGAILNKRTDINAEDLCKN